MITILNHQLNVDIEAELQKYDWRRPRWRGEKFLACSPFRNERNPSFAVHLKTGVWIDSGSDGDEWNKGSFPKLLSWLRNETVWESEDYLLQSYCLNLQDIDHVQLSFNLFLESPKVGPLSADLLTQYRFRHPYLSNKRGIEEKYQRAFQIGYDRQNKAVTFPWFDKDGQLATVKFRSINHKWFWYHPDGQPIKNHLYGLNIVNKTGKTRLCIVESEIDAITLWQAGQPAVALGGANLSRRQRELILQSSIEELIIATDNDQPGKRIAESIIRQLGGYVHLKCLQLPKSVKDVNDLTKVELLQVRQQVKDCCYWEKIAS
ncbi:toprim domain-containing protein [Heliobacterium chlorum]|uniref:toprim domain-containing protein n=1 Tax=Heliobacterium chlorum TaxID=2698 RepID=UPI00311A93FC